jgi:hypothetical protein
LADYEYLDAKIYYGQNNRSVALKKIASARKLFAAGKFHQRPYVEVLYELSEERMNDLESLIKQQ